MLLSLLIYLLVKYPGFASSSAAAKVGVMAAFPQKVVIFFNASQGLPWISGHCARRHGNECQAKESKEGGLAAVCRQLGINAQVRHASRGSYEGLSGASASLHLFISSGQCFPRSPRT